MKNLMMAFALAVAAAGCGSSGGGGGGGGGGNSGAFSCDVTSGGARACTDYSWSGGVYDTTAWNNACSQGGGTAGSGCSHTGAVGGCKVNSTSGTVTVETTSWYYTGTASTYMQACQSANGTWVNP